MSRPLAWFAGHPVAANLLMALLLAGGILTIPSLRQEMLPDVEIEQVVVTVPYPGASPEEVEKAICIPVEEELQSLSGIRQIRSVAREGVGTVTAELLMGEDVARRLADVRARVAALDTLPEEAEPPVVQQPELGRQVLSIAVSGGAGERTLRRIAERVRDGLAALPEVSDVELVAARPYEIAIEVSERDLRRYGLGFSDVVAAVRRSSLDLPGGSLETEAGEILLRATGEAADRDTFARIPLVVRPDGTRLALGDVARVVDGFAETDQRAFFDGEPAVLVEVGRVGDQKLLEVAAAAQAYLERARRQLPDGVRLTVWQSGARYLGERLGSMTDAARSGFVLVVLVLALFLRLRLALWVSLGIPTAFLGAVSLLPWIGVSVNWISLMGFIVVLGIVVDDAIVVGEAIHADQQRTGQRLAGAVRGASRIAVPVVFGVATTVAAFAPMLFLPGTMGGMARALPLVVIACLVFSLLEAMLVLPAHLGHGRGALRGMPSHPAARVLARIQQRASGWLESLVQEHYRPALRAALAWRYLTLALAISALLLTVGLLAGGWVRFVFQERVEGDVMAASLTMAPGTPAAETARAVRRIEEAARAVRAEADAERGARRLRHGSIFRHILTSVGEQPFLRRESELPGLADPSLTDGANLGEVQVAMIAPEHRDIPTETMMRRWRERVGRIPGAAELTFQHSMVSAGSALELELRGGSLDELRAVSASLQERLAGYAGVYDIRDSFRGGKPELRFRLRPEAESLGIGLADVAREVRRAFHGEEAQRIQRGRDEVKVMVRYPPAERRSLADLETLPIRAADGSERPFAAVAQATRGEGFSTIRRVDRKRVVSVLADVDLSVVSANEIVGQLREDVLPPLRRAHPGVQVVFEGEQAEQREFLSAMLRGQIVALLVIYALLAVPLRSYLQPVLIMSVIPFGLVGAVWGHLLLGFDFSMYSVIGVVALSGVVVNASLVLVDGANRLRAEGRSLARAMQEAAAERFRPIWLTSLTTFAGLTPMMLERSTSARFLIPTAISLAFGVLFASVITLFVLPCGALVLEDLRTLARRGQAAWRGDAAAGEAGSEGLGEGALP